MAEDAPWSHAEIHLAADEQITDPVSLNFLKYPVLHFLPAKIANIANIYSYCFSGLA